LNKKKDIMRVYLPPDANLICNFDLYYAPQLRYYAKHEISNGLINDADWKTYIQAEDLGGGIVWMGAPESARIVASSRPETVRFVLIDGIRFAVWQPVARPKSAP
jgi:hypothetical protein